MPPKSKSKYSTILAKTEFKENNTESSRDSSYFIFKSYIYQKDEMITNFYGVSNCL